MEYIDRSHRSQKKVKIIIKILSALYLLLLPLMNLSDLSSDYHAAIYSYVLSIVGCVDTDSAVAKYWNSRRISRRKPDMAL